MRVLYGPEMGKGPIITYTIAKNMGQIIAYKLLRNMTKSFRALTSARTMG